MAISNDSFGSPGLGEGIGLQGTLKDYTPLIAKSRLAEQAMISKAAQKKLEQDLQDQEKLDKELARLNATAGIPAFTPRYKEEGLKVIKVIEKLKNENKPILTNPEFLKAKFEFQQNMDKIRFEEDEIKRQITGFGKDPNNEEYDYEYFNSLWDESGKSLSAINPERKPTIVPGRQFIKKLPKYNLMKDMADMQKTVKPEVMGKTYMTTLSDGTQTIAYDETSEFDQQKIDQAWNRFKTFDSVQNEAKKLVEKQFYPDINSALSALELDFKRPFENSRKIKSKQKFEKDSGLGGAGGGLGTTDWNFQSQKDDNDSKNLTAVVYNEQLATFVDQPNTKNILDFIEKYKTSSGNRFIIDRSDVSQVDKAIKDFESLVDNENKDAMELGKKMYGDGFNKDTPIGKAPPRQSLKGKSEELYFSPRGKEAKTFTVISYNGERLDNAVVLSYGKVYDASGKEHKFFKVKVPDKKGGEEMYVPADESSFGKENRNTIGTPIGIQAERFDEAIKKYYTAGTKPTKFDKGGQVEPKEISKRFHDKSRNMTKFVYSDGSEEIFKGLL